MLAGGFGECFEEIVDGVADDARDDDSEEQPAENADLLVTGELLGSGFGCGLLRSGSRSVGAVSTCCNAPWGSCR
jgi:hypothetical protein